MKKLLVIKNDMSEIPKLAVFIERVCSDLHLPQPLTMKLNLVLEEAVTNIILYAYPQALRDEITVNVQKRDDRLTITITDGGIAFDPTRVKDADISLTAEERPIGGLGIFLIRKIMDEVEYKRMNDSNIFIMKKALHTASGKSEADSSSCL